MGFARKLLYFIAGAVVALSVVSIGVYYLGGFGGGASGGEKPRVVVVDVEGTIDNFRTAHVVSKLVERESVKAVVVKVNSPGGYVSPSFQLEAAISHLAEEKPTVGAVGHLGASGAYLAASAVDNLYLHHSSVVGSLGVIAVWTSYEEYFENKGIEHHVFKTGPHKDMFAPWRGPTENEKELIENEIKRIRNRMVCVIARNRPAIENDIPLPLIKGETVKGFRAVAMDLADGIIWTPDEAVEKAAREAGLEKGEYSVVKAEKLVG